MSNADNEKEGVTVAKDAPQGRNLALYEFPSPASREMSFMSRSVCLIDLGNTLVVLTRGNESSHQNGLYRLEIPGRDQVRFEDDSKLSKEECKDLLRDTLNLYPLCQIHAVYFPFFDPGNLNKFKLRPSVCLYGEGDRAIYLSIYMGVPRAAESSRYDWEMYVSGDDHLFPPEAALSTIDVSKICTLPDTYDDPGNVLHGSSTFGDFKLDFTNHPKVLVAKNGTELRRHVMMKLDELLLKNPYFEYHDSTRELDVGTEVYARTCLDGEEVRARVIHT